MSNNEFNNSDTTTSQEEQQQTQLPKKKNNYILILIGFLSLIVVLFAVILRQESPQVETNPQAMSPVLSPQVSAAQQKKWKTYHDTTSGMAFEYPQDWLLDIQSVTGPSGKTSDILWLIATNTKKQTHDDAIIIDWDSNPNKLDLVEYIKEYYQGDKNNIREEVLKSVPNNNGIAFKKLSKELSNDQANKIVEAMHNGRYYSLVTYFENGHNNPETQENLKVFDEIVKKFNITKEPALPEQIVQTFYDDYLLCLQQPGSHAYCDRTKTTPLVNHDVLSSNIKFLCSADVPQNAEVAVQRVGDNQAVVSVTPYSEAESFAPVTVTLGKKANEWKITDVSCQK